MSATKTEPVNQISMTS